MVRYSLQVIGTLDRISPSFSGRVEPIPFYVKNDLTGLGKSNQDVRMSKYRRHHLEVYPEFDAFLS